MNKYYAFLKQLSDRKDFDTAPTMTLMIKEFPELNYIRANSIIQEWNNEGRPGA